MSDKNSGTFTLINDKTGDKYTLPVIDGATGPALSTFVVYMGKQITSLLILATHLLVHVNPA